MGRRAAEVRGSCVHICGLWLTGRAQLRGDAEGQLRKRDAACVPRVAPGRALGAVCERRGQGGGATGGDAALGGGAGAAGPADAQEALHERVSGAARGRVQEWRDRLPQRRVCLPTSALCVLLTGPCCSMLPQLVSVASEGVLHELAVQLFAFDAFPDSQEKSAAISTLLSAAIASATFFRPAPPPLPRFAYASWHLPQLPPPAVDHAVLAKCYMQTCVALGCPDLVGAVLDRAGDTAALTPPHAQECARMVMLPLVAACADHMREKLDSVLRDKLEELRAKAMELYLEWFAAKKESLTRLDVAGLIEVAVVDGDASMLVER